MRQQDLVETLMDMVPMIVAINVATRMASDLYRENPQLFWSYMQKKTEMFIYNCRM
jgi:hypothetical protein